MCKEISEITSVADLLQESIKTEKDFFWDPGMGESQFWYRGQSDEKWELQPAVLRKKHANMIHRMESAKSRNRWNNVLENERTINRRFRSEAYPHLDDIPAIRMYFAAQHYGLPTRLLDWSLSPLVAMYFACRDESNIKKDGCVYRLFPRNLPDIFEGQPHAPPSPFDDIVSTYRPIVMEFIESCLFDSNPPKTLQNTPIVPIIPTIIAGRITAQVSRFTFHAPVAKKNSNRIQPPQSLQKIFQGKKHSLVKYIVPASAKIMILAELNRLGTHGYSLFPDLDNLALHLKAIYCSHLYLPFR